MGNKKKIAIIVTSYNEAVQIVKAIKMVAINIKNKTFSSKFNYELIISAPDEETITSAQNITKDKYLDNVIIIKDKGIGKANALNQAIEITNGEIIFFTDGDVYIEDNSISLILPYFDNPKVGIVSGRPISLENRNKFFGYISHIFCEAAHKKRLEDETIPASGYLFAIRKIDNLFPIPNHLRAEDAFIFNKIKENGYISKYEPNAFVYVRFPKNLKDWFNQKIRSLGGNLQADKINKTYLDESHTKQIKPTKTRSISQDLKMSFFPINFAQTHKELLFSLALYPLRLLLWLIILVRDRFNKYDKGMWKRIESSKF